MLEAGKQLGSYQIVALLGAGGMGEVYRARDRKLDRDVAIKVLPDIFATDPERLARFHREAQLLASLNHPNIGAIHDIQEDRGTRFLVLELLEGETLASRLKRGPLPIDDALEVCKQVAEALDAAHEKGIFHRDLKPANIQLISDGRAKVLDFGLAKMMQPETPGESSNSPTMSAAHTGDGIILGTAAYMSPEQARGRGVDKRTDVWALGCVLFEALTARQAFGGETVTDIIASVVKSEPDWSLLPPSTPAAVRALLRQCLRKQPRQRLHDVADARIAIEDALNEAPFREPAAVVSRGRGNWRWTSAAAVVSLLFGIAAGRLFQRPAQITPVVTRLEMAIRPAAELIDSISSVRPSRTAIAISPDGKRVVFSAFATSRGTASRVPQLYSRALDQSEAQPLSGTEQGTGPFFSPDGQWIGFRAGSKIKKVPVFGGPSDTICDVPDNARDWGATWADDGTIYFSVASGIYKVPSAGGTPMRWTTADTAKGERHLLPQALPGAKAILYTVAPEWEKARVVAHPTDGGAAKTLVEGAADARYVRTGHVLYMRMGTLMAVPFHVRDLKLGGAPVAMLEDLMQAINAPNTADETGAGQFAVSDSGTLLYLNGGIYPPIETSLEWLDRKGNAQLVSSAPAKAYIGVRLSPDEKRAAVFTRAPVPNSIDVWVYDMTRGVLSRMTSSGVNVFPVWSPDGKQLIYGATSSAGVRNLHLLNLDTGRAEPLAPVAEPQSPSSWTPHGNLVAFVQQTAKVAQLLTLPMDGDRKPRLFLESRFTLTHPEFSPDGKWIAYSSNESGRSEVYVQPYPGPGERVTISGEGGNSSLWTANGREIVYNSGGKFLSVAVTSLNPLRTESPQLLFETKEGDYVNTTPTRGWDATRDAQRFLLLRRQESKDQAVKQIHAVLNWFEELKRRAPAK